MRARKAFFLLGLIGLFLSQPTYSQNWVEYPNLELENIHYIFEDEVNDRLFVSGDKDLGTSSEWMLKYLENGIWKDFNTDIPDGSFFQAINLCIMDSILYGLIEYFDTIQFAVLKRIARFEGNSWSFLGDGFEQANWSGSYIPPKFNLCSYQNKLYISGYYTYGSDSTSRALSFWNGTNWQHIDSIRGAISCMNQISGTLNLSGDFQLGNDTNKVGYASWDGNIVYPVITGQSFMIFEEYLADIYLTSWGGNPGPRLYKFDNSALTQLAAFDNYPIYSMKSHQNRLYMGGCFEKMTSGAPSDHVMYVDDQLNMHPVNDGVNGIVYQVMLHDNILVIRGSFDTAGTVPANGFIGWDITQSIDEIASNSKVQIYPNPVTSSLYFEAYENEVSLQIFGVNGNIELSTQFNTVIGINSIDVSRLKPGVYFIRMESVDHFCSSKFIKI